MPETCKRYIVPTEWSVYLGAVKLGRYGHLVTVDVAAGGELFPRGPEPGGEGGARVLVLLVLLRLLLIARHQLLEHRGRGRLKTVTSGGFSTQSFMGVSQDNVVLGGTARSFNGASQFLIIYQLRGHLYFGHLKGVH